MVGLSLNPRWLVTCSCGWTSEFSQRRHAESVAKLHPKLGEPGIEHTVTIEEPPRDPPPGAQLTLGGARLALQQRRDYLKREELITK
jgi:hypothetical protein